MRKNSEIEIYQSPDGHTEVQVTFDDNTVWLNQEQLGQLFERDWKTYKEYIQRR